MNKLIESSECVEPCLVAVFIFLILGVFFVFLMYEVNSPVYVEKKAVGLYVSEVFSDCNYVFLNGRRFYDSNCLIDKYLNVS